MEADLIEFKDDDIAYLRWLNMHPDGYVVNTTRNKSPDYMVLHRASCQSISQYSSIAKPGGFTERGYIKVCADQLNSLKSWVRRSGCPNGTFSSECSCLNEDWWEI
jgi:hypothetical protein